jgi:predicted RNA-binding Zn-ribbon protein involved in translation (DUF1610 family)
MMSELFQGRLCPACGHGVHRAARSTLDRLASVVVPARRYRCEQCGWTGLLRVRQHRRFVLGPRAMRVAGILALLAMVVVAGYLVAGGPR